MKIKVSWAITVLLSIMLTNPFSGVAQLSGAKTIPADYPTIAAFVTDLNLQGVGSGGVTFTIPAGYTETAPVGGFIITATGTAVDQIIIQGGGLPKPIITANAGLTPGALNDAIIVLSGSDFVTISSLELVENGANSTTASGTNNMTEWGIALVYATSTDGARFNTIQNNTITLNRSYSNSFGIYSNTRHTLSAPTAPADITALSGANSGNKFYGNTISNVNLGISIVGSTFAGGMDVSNDIGGTSALTGNIISNYGGQACASAFVSVSGTSFGIFSNHQIGENISYNSITSAVVSGTSTSHRGILKDYSAAQPSGTFTSTISNNIITLNSAFTSGVFEAIKSQGLTPILATATLNMNNNSILNCSISGVASSSALVGISNSSIFGTISISNTIIQGNSSTATTAGFTGIVNSAAASVAVTLDNNQIGNGSGNAITFSAASSGNILGISNTGGTNTCALSMSGNNVQGIVNSVNGTGTQTYINNTAATFSQTINNNTFTNLNAMTSGNVRFIQNDVALPAGGAANVNGNSIVTAFNKGVAGGTVFAYFTSTGPSSAVGSTKTEQNNNFSNITLTGATTMSGWADLEGATGGGPTKTISNNTFNNWICGSSAVTVIQTNYGGASSSVSNNLITNISGSGAITGISIGSSNGSGTHSYSGNTITGLISSATGGTVLGITGGSGSIATLNIANNIISSLSSSGLSSTVAGINTTAGAIVNINSNSVSAITGSGTTSPLSRGIAVSAGTTLNIFKNKITDISQTGTIATTSAAVCGLVISGGTNVNAYNNVIGDLKALDASLTDAIRGINITSATASSTIRVYYNTVYLNAVSASGNFGTSGIFHTANATSTTAALDLRNNIIINESVAAGAGTTVAFRRSGTALNNYASTSNRNLFYAGTPSVTNLIFNDGTTLEQSFTNYKTLVSTRDANSITGEAFTYSAPGSYFISLTPSNANYLRPIVGAISQTESGAEQISSPSITDDIAAVVRAGNVGYAGTGTAPDMGAFEFEGVTPAPVITLNSVTPPASAACATTNRLVSVTATTVAGTITGAVLNYSFNGTPQTPVVMTNTVGSIWEGTMLASVPVNATVTWNVVATNSILLSSTYTGSSYTDEPLFGLTATATANPLTVCAGEDVDLTASLTSPGNPTYIAPPAVSNPASDEDFTNITITQGVTTILNNTSVYNSLSGTIGTATGTAGSYSDFTSFGPYELTAGTTYNYSVSSFLAGGFGNSMAIYIDFNRNGVFTDAGEKVHSVPSTTGGAHTESGTFTVPSNTGLGLTRMRVMCHEGVITLPTQAISWGEYEEYTVNLVAPSFSVSWSDGVASVGTGVNLTVNPATSTTYTASVNGFGCTYTPAPSVLVNVNALPSAPTATNSTQCGSQIAGAFVTSTTGAGSPVFNWYDAPTGGNLLQSNVIPQYITSISVTTTFYVSEVDGVTGCESTRTPVVATVIIPDPVTATIALTPICEGETITLTASNNNPVPVQNYTYVWSGPIGSGAEAGFSGTSITVTPTLPGNYSYLLTAVDGICTTTANATADVNPIPTMITATSSAPMVCNGDVFDLFSSAQSNSTEILTTVYNETFDAGLNGWTIVNDVASPVASNWAAQNAPYNYAGYFTNFSTVQGGGFLISVADAGGSGSTTNSQLVSPVLSTVGMSNADVTFENLYQKWTSGDVTVSIEASTDGGSNWTLLKDYLVLGNQGVTTSGAQVPASETITLAAGYLGQSNLKFRFNYVSSWGFYWAVDDFAITGMQSAPGSLDWTSVPVGFTSTDQNPTAVAPTADADYTVTITNSFGCKDSASVFVNVEQPTASNLVVTDCDTHILNSTTYTTSGTYVQNLMNVAGCDSTITLDLTINYSNSSFLTVSQCGSYDMNGATYTNSGVYTQLVSNIAGCDSLINLDLTILPEASNTLTVSGCESYTHNTTTYTTSGVYTQTLTSVNGCDSILTLNVTIYGPASITDNGNGTFSASAGASYQWIDCATMTPIPGATFQTFVPKQNGSYAVIVDNGGGCSDTTNCATISDVSVVEVDGQVVSIYPNPTRDNVTVNFESTTANLEIYDGQGKLVESILIERGSVVSLEQFERGMYYFRVMSDNVVTTHRIVKQ